MLPVSSTLNAMRSMKSLAGRLEICIITVSRSMLGALRENPWGITLQINTKGLIRWVC